MRNLVSRKAHLCKRLLAKNRKYRFFYFLPFRANSQSRGNCECFRKSMLKTRLFNAAFDTGVLKSPRIYQFYLENSAKIIFPGEPLGTRPLDILASQLSAQDVRSWILRPLTSWYSAENAGCQGCSEDRLDARPLDILGPRLRTQDVRVVAQGIGLARDSLTSCVLS